MKRHFLRTLLGLTLTLTLFLTFGAFPSYASAIPKDALRRSVSPHILPGGGACLNVSISIIERSRDPDLQYEGLVRVQNNCGSTTAAGSWSFYDTVTCFNGSTFSQRLGGAGLPALSSGRTQTVFDQNRVAGCLVGGDPIPPTEVSWGAIATASVQGQMVTGADQYIWTF